jgi:hypothetical protein
MKNGVGLEMLSYASSVFIFSYFLKYSDRPLGDELHPLRGFSIKFHGY